MAEKKQEVVRSTGPGRTAFTATQPGAARQPAVASNHEVPSGAGAAEFYWPLPPAHVQLGGRQIHVWCAGLEGPPSKVAAFAKTLSDPERKRAERFQFERDRDRFIIRRGLLRRMLGCYLNTDPAQVTFTYESRGKPVLAGITDGQMLQFNLSHSHGLALFAVARQAPLGIDLERIRPIPELDQIAARFFSPYENALLDDLPKEQVPEAFFHCWTRKEAYLKATGEGIADSLPEVEVSLSPWRAAQLVSIAGDLQAAGLWTLHALAPAPGFVGALAVKAKGLEALCWRWPSGEGDSVSLDIPEEIRMG